MAHKLMSIDGSKSVPSGSRTMTRTGKLHDEVVLVTGAGRGIGRAIALRCADDGAHLALAGRSTELLEETANMVRKLGRRATVVPVDLRDPTSIESGVAQVCLEFGRIDVLVANSGIAGPTAPVWQVDPQEWDDTMDVNLTGTYRCCRAVFPAMVERHRGNIVVVGSMTGKRPLAARSAYAASKLALVGFVRTAALDVGPYGVRINLVSPGPVSGARLDRVLATQVATSGIAPHEAARTMFGDAPLGRPVNPEEVASAVAFLASDDAAGITGEDLNVSCGAVGY